MPFDGIVTNAVVRELSSLLEGGHIERVYQTSQDEIVLFATAVPNTSKGRKDYIHVKFLISAAPDNPCIHLTEMKRENPTIAPNFCMVLRKYIAGGTIKAIRQKDFDRIIEIDIESRNELGDLAIKTLVIEIMGRYSNIILLNSDRVIHDCIRHVDETMSSVRELLPAHPYVYPLAQAKVSPKDFTEFMRPDEDIDVCGLILSSIEGFSPIVAVSICRKIGIDPHANVSTILGDTWQELSKITRDVCQDATNGKYSPCILSSGKDFHASKIVLDESDKPNVFTSMNECVDKYHQAKYERDLISNTRSSLEHKISAIAAKLKKKIKLREATLSDARDAEKYKSYGELITASLYMLPNSADKIEVTDYYAEPDESGNYPIVAIKLDGTKSVKQNADNFFKKYRKMIASREATSKFLEGDLMELEYLEGALAMLGKAESVFDMNEIEQELIEEGFLRPTRDKLSKNANQGNCANQKNFPGKPSSRAKTKAFRAMQNAKSKSANGKKSSNSNNSNNSGNFRDSDNLQDNEKSKYIRFTTDSGNTVLVGRNGKMNDRLTFKTAKNGDIWFHVKNTPGSHVILVREKGKDLTDSDYIFAASVAAAYSSISKTSKAEVDYTQAEYVKKIPGSHPGLVTYTNYSSIIVTPRQF